MFTIWLSPLSTGSIFKFFSRYSIISLMFCSPFLTNLGLGWITESTGSSIEMPRINPRLISPSVNEPINFSFAPTTKSMASLASTSSLTKASLILLPDRIRWSLYSLNCTVFKIVKLLLDNTEINFSQCIHNFRGCLSIAIYVFLCCNS